MVLITKYQIKSKSIFYRDNTIVLFLILQEEEHRLQQELTELAINLNMEAQKGRKQKFDFNR